MPIRSALFALAGAALLCSPAAAQAQSLTLSQQDREDIECVGTMAIVVANAPAEESDGINSLMMYFIGKLRGRMPNVPLATLLDDDLEARIMPDLEQLAERCVREVGQVSDEMVRFGNAGPAK